MYILMMRATNQSGICYCQGRRLSSLAPDDVSFWLAHADAVCLTADAAYLTAYAAYLTAYAACLTADTTACRHWCGNVGRTASCCSEGALARHTLGGVPSRPRAWRGTPP